MRAAILLGQKLGATLYFIHVVDSSALPAMSPIELKNELNEQAKRQNQDALEAQVRMLYANLRVRAKEVPYECIIANKPLDLAIATYTSSLNIDLIIMGTSGASGFQKIIGGSNTSAVIKKSNISVLVIPFDFVFSSIRKVAMTLNVHDFEHKKSITILNDIVNTYNAELEYFYIVPKDNSIMEAHTKLKQIATGLPIVQNEVEIHIKESEPIAKTLEQWLKEHNCDLVVMHPREWTIGKFIFTTSMTQEMAHRAKLPLLILQ
jgi:nucleotide-binding universal stress UspA family protein